MFSMYIANSPLEHSSRMIEFEPVENVRVEDKSGLPSRAATKDTIFWWLSWARILRSLSSSSSAFETLAESKI